MAASTRDQLQVPAEFWQRPEVCAALEQRDMGRLFRLLRQYCGASQTRIGAVVGLSQGAVSPIMNGGQAVTALRCWNASRTAWTCPTRRGCGSVWPWR